MNGRLAFQAIAIVLLTVAGCSEQKQNFRGEGEKLSADQSDLAAAGKATRCSADAVLIQNHCIGPGAQLVFTNQPNSPSSVFPNVSYGTASPSENSSAVIVVLKTKLGATVPVDLSTTRLSLVGGIAGSYSCEGQGGQDFSDVLHIPEVVTRRTKLGRVKFPGLYTTKSCRNVQLVAHFGPFTGYSAPFDVIGPAAVVRVHDASQGSWLVNTSHALEATIEDAAGNRVRNFAGGTVNLSLAGPQKSAAKLTQGHDAPVQTIIQGLAQFPAVAIDIAGNDYTIRAVVNPPTGVEAPASTTSPPFAVSNLQDFYFRNATLYTSVAGKPGAELAKVVSDQPFCASVTVVDSTTLPVKSLGTNNEQVRLRLVHDAGDHWEPKPFKILGANNEVRETNSVTLTFIANTGVAQICNLTIGPATNTGMRYSFRFSAGENLKALADITNGLTVAPGRPQGVQFAPLAAKIAGRTFTAQAFIVDASRNRTTPTSPGVGSVTLFNANRPLTLDGQTTCSIGADGSCSFNISYTQASSAQSPYILQADLAGFVGTTELTLVAGNPGKIAIEIPEGTIDTQTRLRMTAQIQDIYGNNVLYADNSEAPDLLLTANDSLTDLPVPVSLRGETIDQIHLTADSQGRVQFTPEAALSINVKGTFVWKMSSQTIAAIGSSRAFAVRAGEPQGLDADGLPSVIRGASTRTVRISVVDAFGNSVDWLNPAPSIALSQVGTHLTSGGFADFEFRPTALGPVTLTATTEIPTANGTKDITKDFTTQIENPEGVLSVAANPAGIVPANTDVTISAIYRVPSGTPTVNQTVQLRIKCGASGAWKQKLSQNLVANQSTFTFRTSSTFCSPSESNDIIFEGTIAGVNPAAATIRVKRTTQRSCPTPQIPGSIFSYRAMPTRSQGACQEYCSSLGMKMASITAEGTERAGCLPLWIATGINCAIVYDFEFCDMGTFVGTRICGSGDSLACNDDNVCRCEDF